MSLVSAALFQLTFAAGPMDAALKATEAPATLRAAFTVEMTSEKAKRTYRFDPRLEPTQRWQLVSASGEDGALDEAGAAWGAEIAPDGRLFPDDLRASLGQRVQVDDLGAGWRLRFRHTPSENDTELDVWATQRLRAVAWLEPEIGRFLRIDYTLPQPVRGPNGGRLTAFNQVYLLETEPVWDLTYVSRYQLSFEAQAGFRTIRQSYQATVKDASFFFANEEAREAYLTAQAAPIEQAELVRR
ncbi:MAG: hypothetical protein AAGJ84_12135 [Pseudomonadota bacterium]